MRQAEDAERTMADRERVLEAVKAQEAHIAVAARKRDAVVDSVNKQQEYMDFMLDGKLRFVKRTASEDKATNDDEPQAVVVNNKNVQEEEAAESQSSSTRTTAMRASGRTGPGLRPSTLFR